MPDPYADELKPTDKDPAEGAQPGEEDGAPATVDPADSHLGEGGDPAEG